VRTRERKRGREKAVESEKRRVCSVAREIETQKLPVPVVHGEPERESRKKEHERGKEMSRERSAVIR
jgi:sugar phosphate isomerase/epimerase